MADDAIVEARERGHTNLYLNYLRLSEIPESLLALHGIKNVYLKYNIITKLPKKIFLLRKLEELYLHSNNLQELPEEIGGLHKLLSLNVSNNFLKSLTPSIGQLKMLQKLHLTNNDLTDLPKEIGLLDNLKVLDVTNNKLKQLPWELSNCSSLECLAFDGNKVSSIPLSFLKLHKLQEFSASRNKITSLPQDFDQLTAMTDLYLDANLSLGMVPATVLRMSHVKVFGFNRCGESVDLPLNNSARDRSSVISLHECALRTVWKHTAGRTVENVLPSSLRDLLIIPQGHCFLCGQAFFLDAFADTLDAGKTLQTLQPSNVDSRTFSNANVSFVFVTCSRPCWSHLSTMLSE